MVKLWKILTVVMAGLLITTCEMGLGPLVDLDPPVLTITAIVRPDGIEEPIEEGNKLFIGPGLRVGAGFTLKGVARDNVRVEEILVEETGPNAKLVDGNRPTWRTPVTSTPARRGGDQEWSIVLEGIDKGERSISITALDKPKNIGPDTVKQLTLMVDTDPPFVENVKVERRAGLQVDLLPRTTLESFSLDLFGHVDYFQNEQFAIRAAVSHDFTLANVWLNFTDASGSEVFPRGLDPDGGSIYAPIWNITADMLIKARPALATGKHYLNVVITAKAEAGHSGSNGGELSNLLYNLCWWPESDLPRIVNTDAAEDGRIHVQTNGIVLVNVFDDDELHDVYGTMITAGHWNSAELWDRIAGTPFTDDDEKLQWLVTRDNKYTFPNENESKYPLRDDLLNKTSTRNAVIPINAGESHGEHKMVVLTRDRKTGISETPWVSKVFTVMVTEDGIPVINIKEPQSDNPKLVNNGFTLKGNITNVDEVKLLRILWVPAAIAGSWDTNAREALLIGTQSGTLPSGIKIWDLDLVTGDDLLIPPAKIYKVQNFEKTFDVFTDFVYNGNIENDTKSFMLYTHGTNGLPVFETLALMSYKQPPVINVVSPSPSQRTEVPPNTNVPFNVQVTSDLGVPIRSVDIQPPSDATQGWVTAPSQTSANTWTATARQSVLKTYTYKITAEDVLGNRAEQETQFTVTEPPTLLRVTSPHDNSNYYFANNEVITIQAEFDGTVFAVTGTPRIVLGGFTQGSTQMYANYVSGAGSKNLIFAYTVTSGYYTEGLTATAIQIPAGATIGAKGMTESANTTYTFATPPSLSGVQLPTAPSLPATKTIRVDSVPPTITGITLSVTDGTFDTAYYTAANGGWVKEGAEIVAVATFSKPIQVMGAPSLILPFTGKTALAGFDSSSGSTIRFTYKVVANDTTAPTTGATQDNSRLAVNRASCFSSADCAIILDTRGADGNMLSLGGAAVTSAIRVDAIPPAALNVARQSGNTFVISNPNAIEPLMTGTNILTNRRVQNTTNGGTDWSTGTMADPWQITVSGNQRFMIQARQIDRAGNISPDGNTEIHDLSATCDLVTIICDEPNRTYKQNDVLRFKLSFTSPVYSTNSGTTNSTPTLVLWGGTATGATGNINLNAPSITAANATDIIEYTWTVPAGRIMNRVQITAVNNLDRLTSSRTGGTPANKLTSERVDNSRDDFLKRPGMAVLSTPITASITGVPAAGLGPVTVGTAQKSQLTLTFNRAVAAEAGKITIRPAAGWHIPPVLSNDDYVRVLNALPTTAQQNRLNSFYKKTTHGLLKNTSGQYTGTPDASTKYVLNFAEDISGTSTNVNDLRILFEAAKYLWQEVEVVSTDQVKFSGTTTIPGKLAGYSGNIVTVTLDRLPDGRTWKVEMDAGTFLDVAGNTFDGWSTTTTNTFWSAKTAEPVIRVNRISTNSPTTTPTTVQYRIDCETPGATISYRTDETRFAAPPTNNPTRMTTAGGTLNSAVRDDNVIYGPRSDPYSDFNNDYSQIRDASADNLATLINGTLQSYNTIGTIPSGANPVPLYTARKDYIGALATHTALAQSSPGYEGAFKTVIIYRKPVDRYPDLPGGGNDVDTALGTSQYIKIEAVDQRNGAVKTAGFPMSFNDMTGGGSMHVYRVPEGNRQLTGIDDWVWISWEMVTEFWHTALAVNRPEPNLPVKTNVNNTGITENYDAWMRFSGDWFNHNYRRYGNWGLRVSAQYQWSGDRFGTSVYRGEK
jgi:hypothetical protein